MRFDENSMRRNPKQIFKKYCHSSMMKIMIHHDTWKHMKTINLGIRWYWYHVFKPNQNQWWDEVPVQTYWVWQLEFHPAYISVTFPTHLRRVSNISPTSRSRSSLFASPFVFEAVPLLWWRMPHDPVEEIGVMILPGQTNPSRNPLDPRVVIRLNSSTEQCRPMLA